MSHRSLCRAATALAVAMTIGCGYTTRGLYPEDIQTVAVPVFKNTTLRRGIEFDLTENVIQRIESRTPFKVVDERHADATIRGEITSFFKNPNGEDGFDNPRGGVMYLTLNVSWIDNRTGEIVHVGTTNVPILKASVYSIDTGQSQATAQHDLVDQLADQVVTMLQNPW